MLPYFYIGDFQIFSYPLILGCIWALAFNFSKYLIKLKNINIPHFNLFFIGTFMSAWLGAKTLFLVTLKFDLAQKAFGSTNFWLGGGFVFYGGLLAGILFVLGYTFKFKLDLMNFKFMIPVLTLGHGVGRIGCFLAGCCYGGYCELPWAINLHGGFRHPVQLYEATTLLFFSYYLYKRFLNDKSVFSVYIILYSLLRFVLEFFRGDSIRGVFLFGVSTSQIIALCLFITFSIWNFIQYYKRLSVQQGNSIK